MRGKRGGVKGALRGLVHPVPASVRLYISTVELTPALELSPENAMIRPSPSAVAVPYQRPSAMLGVSRNSPVTGSKMDARFSPAKEPVVRYAAVPPTTRGRPSGSTAVPLQ